MAQEPPVFTDKTLFHQWIYWKVNPSSSGNPDVPAFGFVPGSTTPHDNKAYSMSSSPLVVGLNAGKKLWMKFHLHIRSVFEGQLGTTLEFINYCMPEAVKINLIDAILMFTHWLQPLSWEGLTLILRQIHLPIRWNICLHSCLSL